MIKEIKFTNPYFTQLERVNFLQRVILIHATLYYVHNRNIISDREYDSIAQQLKRETDKLSIKERAATQYWYVFSDFSPSTGFDLYDRLHTYDKKVIDRIAHSCYNGYTSTRKGE